MDFNTLNYEWLKSHLGSLIELDYGVSVGHIMKSSQLRQNALMAEDVSVHIVIRYGTATATINGRDTVIYPGTICIVQPGDIVSACNIPDDCEGMIFVIAVNRMLELMSDVGLHRYLLQLHENPIVYLPVSNQKVIFSLIDVLLDKTAGQPLTEGSSKVCMAVLQGIVYEVFETLEEVAENSRTIETSRPDAIFKHFTSLLSTLTVHPRDVEWYARRLCITPKYLSEICRNKSGRSAASWIKDYAIIDIRRQLIGSDRSIKEIAHFLGYSNLSFFGKCVRRWFGMSPTELRVHLRKSPESSGKVNPK